MKTRELTPGLAVSAVGLGCMGLSHGYGPPADRQEAVRLIQQAADMGYTFFDTTEIYGPFDNEEIAGSALAAYKGRAVVATKFGITHMNDNTGEMVLDSSPNAIRRAVDGSLFRLRRECVDLYYQHRQDPNTPVEVVAQTMEELIKAGKIRYWGLSAVDGETIRRAHAVCPVAAVQSEYSMMYRKLEKDVLPVCEELGIGVVPYSPLAKGFLSGKVDRNTVYPKGDLRNIMARFRPEAMEANQALLRFVEETAAGKQATPAQISLAWVMARNPRVVPIPGTRSPVRLAENAGAAEVTLSKEEYERINELLSAIAYMEVNF